MSKNMNDPRLRPTQITHDKEKHELRISWADEYTSVFPLDALREACPCADCRGGHEYMGPEHDPNLLTLTPVRSYKIVNMEIQGNYALQITWDDGHSAGIYTWEYFRRIDPSAPENEKQNDTEGA